MVLAAAFVAAAMIGTGLGTVALMEPDEGRNAEVAREMMASGAWLTPTLDGVDYLDKPAFFFRLVATSLSVGGVSEGAARAPSALFAAGLLGLIYAFARRESGGRAAALAVMVASTTPLFFIFARLVIFDMTLAFFVCGAIFAGYLAERAEAPGRRRWYLVAWASAALATLTKGPVGLIVPALVLGVFHWLDGRSGWRRPALSPANIALYLGLVLPWFVALSLRHPDFLHYGLVEESFRRFTTDSFGRTQPFYYYAVVVAVAFLPWSLLLPEQVACLWAGRSSWRSLDRLCAVWFVVVILFFSVSRSKLPGYVLSLCAPIAIQVGCLLDRAISRPEGREARMILRGAGLLALVVVAGAGWWLAVTSFGDGAHHAHHGHARAYVPASLFRLPALVAMLLAVSAGAYALWRRSIPAAGALLVAVPLAVVLSGVGAFREYADSRSGQTLAQRLRVLPPDVEIACFRCFPASLPFYLERTLTVVTPDGRELRSNYIRQRLRDGGPWPPSLVPVPAFESWLDARRHPVYVLVQTRRREVLDALAKRRGLSTAEVTPEYRGVMLAPAPGS